MRVRIHPGDQKGVGFTRAIWPGNAARAEGIEVEIADNLPILRRVHKTGTMIKAEQIDADVFVFQRVSNPELLALIPQLQARGQAVVVDVDDDISSQDPRNAAYGHENPRNVLKACALADIVTVTTPALAERYRTHGRVVVVPNCVPEALLYMPRDSDGRTVGWGGWIGSHPGDLQVTRGGVADAVERTGARFHVVGPKDGPQGRRGVQKALGLREPPSDTGALTNVAGYEFERALGELDVGIVPLADTRFNAAKSNLKGLQYAARGVPFVASPVAEYARLASEGAGVLAPPRERNWRSRIVELLTDEALRAEMAGRGRELVRDLYTFEGNAHRWIDAWEAALEHRQSVGRMAVAA